ncbi:SH3 domain-containing protein 3 [Phalaenopsis equestris]|uniref:SH3 domain-containing protein 3 n=1 Tax=Phalaenopsis equestris TaxID=78828 RepID=UPI0009E5F288|nr:SH3 domain-containing protein 3 [Phalaenopsis equestris]
MDKLRKQASKLREQVAKQQQAVIKQFSGSGYESSGVMVIDEVELYRHQQLEKLYKSTRTARDFQKDVVRAGDVFASIGHRHIEAGTKLSEDCFKYGGENYASDGTLAKVASLYGGALVNVEKEYEEYNKILITQMLEPLRAMATGTALEDARHLAQRYSRMRQEAEAQVGEVSRRQSRVKEAPIFENTSKLQSSESRMQDLKANMAVLGKEAAAALAAVESQQQRLTLQRLVAMVEAEKSFHLRVAAILDDVEAEMLSEKQRKESAIPSVPNHTPQPSPKRSEKALYFLAEAVHPFTAFSEKELSLAVGDYVVVRQVDQSGWSEGECKGKAGWFPSAFVERRQDIPPNKVLPHDL